jgi:energy-converting hydrogenase Eha subunit A
VRVWGVRMSVIKIIGYRLLAVPCVFLIVGLVLLFLFTGYMRDLFAAPTISDFDGASR